MIRRGRRHATARNTTPYGRPEPKAQEPGFIGSIKNAAFGFLGFFSGSTDETSEDHADDVLSDDEDIGFIPAQKETTMDENDSNASPLHEDENDVDGEADGAIIEYRGFKLTMKDTRMKDLKKLLQESNLSTKGSKKDLLQRLTEYAKTHPHPRRHAVTSRTPPTHHLERESKEFAASANAPPTPDDNRRHPRRSPHRKHISFDEEPVSHIDSAFVFHKKEDRSAAKKAKVMLPPSSSSRSHSSEEKTTDDDFLMSDQPNVPVSQWTTSTAPENANDDLSDDLPQDYYPGKFSANPHARRAYHPGRRSLATFSESVPSARKRVRDDSNRPVSTSKYANTHQTFDSYSGTPSSRPRNSRCPRPSRFLTGRREFQPISQTSTPTDAAQRIFEALNEMTTPLERERKKPLATPSLAWAKYGKMLELEDSTGPALDGEALPPRGSIPKIPFQTPKVAKSPVATDEGETKAQAPAAPSPPPPAAASGPKRPVSIQSVPAKTKSSSPYQFTPAPKKMKPATTRKEKEIKYLFSPAPSKGRSSPIRTVAEEENSTPAKTAAPTPPSTHGVPKAFSFMPPTSNTTPDKVTVSPKKQESAVALPSEAPPAVPMDSSNPLMKFMKTDDSKWKCAVCAVSNPNNLTKCPCCEADRPSGTTTKETAKVASFLDAKPPSASSSGFQFSLPKEQTNGGTSSSGFTFGVPPSMETTNAPAASVQFASTVPSTGPTTTHKAFEFKSVKEPETAGKSNGGVSFGEAASKETGESKPSGFGGAAKDEGAANKTTGFSFGATKEAAKPKEAPAAASGFSFGATTTEQESSKPAGGGFSFGTSTDATTKPPPAVSFGTSAPAAEAKSSFSFTVPAPDKVEATPAPTAAAPGFTFGASTAAEPVAKEEAKKPAGEAGFSFGASTTGAAGTQEARKDNSQTAATPGFKFGEVSPTTTAAATAPPAAKDDTSKAPAFSFGASAPAPPATSTTKDATTGFTFGGSATNESSKPATPGFAFGSTSTPAAATDTKAAPATPAFSFSASTSTTPAPTPSFQPPAAPAAAAATPFGTTPTAAPGGGSAPFAFGASAPTPSTGGTFTFGGQANGTPSASNPFSAPNTAAAAAASPFPPAPAMGTNTTNAAPSFGVPNNSGMDTGNQQQQQQQPFGFGQAAAPPMQQPAAFSFGGNQPAHFGMTAPPPSAAAPAFGASGPGPASSSGAFSIGSAPTKKVRRIVTAKRRAKR